MMNFKVALSSMVFFSICLYPVTAGNPAFWREDFNNTEKKNDLCSPSSWRLEATKPGVSATSFYVIADRELQSNKLVVEADKATGGLMCNPSAQVDLTKTPILRWRWRVKNLPPGGDGRCPDKDDQAVAIYIGFNDWVRKKSISYRYETETPAGESGHVSYAAGMVNVTWYCLRNKNDGAGKWYTEERNVAEDLKKAYGIIPKEFVISICGNSQYTKSHTLAELDYLEFVPESQRLAGNSLKN